MRAAPLARMSSVAALAVALATVSPVPAQVKIPIPPDFTMERAESSPGPVTFSHAKHRAKVGKCSTCHMRDLKMHRGQSGPITLDAKLQGKYCGACHDGKTVIGGSVVFPIEECDKCHAP